ncbi:uncharacterized protein FYW35_000743 [Pterocles gutturalis]
MRRAGARGYRAVSRRPPLTPAGDCPAQPRAPLGSVGRTRYGKEMLKNENGLIIQKYTYQLFTVCEGCGGGRRIAAPTLLAVPRSRGSEPQERTSRSHSFKNKSFKKSKICGICKEVIDSQGISCRVCKYACHRKCEEKVVTPCFFPSNYELANNSEAVKNHVTRTNSSSVLKNSSFSCNKGSRQVFLSYFVQ